MRYFPTVDKRYLTMIVILTASIILILAVSIFGFTNIFTRYSKLSDARQFALGAGELEINQKALMDCYFNLQKISRELSGDSIEVSYNSRVGSIIDKIKSFGIELKEIEYGKQYRDDDILYLPVKFELSGGFEELIRFTHYIENEIQVMGYTSLEMATTGASGADIEMSATINFYRLNK